jgi:hypothetical protein
MTIAIGLSLTFLGRAIRPLVALVGGVGFGFFIDELGKFITADNNYFYKPSAALIYLIFLGLFMAARAMRNRRGYTSSEYVWNAIDLLGEAACRDLDERDRERALRLLDRADQRDPLVGPLRTLLEQVEALPARSPPRVAQWARGLRSAYRRLVCRQGFRSAVSWIFAVWALGSAFAVFELVLSVGLNLGGAHPGFASDQLDDLAFVNIASLASSAASCLFVGIGIRDMWRTSRLGAYAWFERAVLVSIFVTRVFAFVESQFGAVFGLAIDLLLLVTLRYLIDSERRLPPAEQATPAPPRPRVEPVPAT